MKELVGKWKVRKKKGGMKWVWKRRKVAPLSYCVDDSNEFDSVWCEGYVQGRKDAATDAVAALSSLDVYLPSIARCYVVSAVRGEKIGG
jgi:hypothetical protein